MSQVVGTSGSSAPAAVMLYRQTVGPPTIKGRPCVVFEGCSTLGTLGDVVLIDPTQYVAIENEAVPAVSVHVKFLSDEVVFRIVYRPAFASAVTPYNGSGVTKSPYIALAAR